MTKMMNVGAKTLFAELSSDCNGTRRHMVDWGVLEGRLEWRFAPVYEHTVSRVSFSNYYDSN